MLWSKQYYALDVERWLAEHGVDPLAAEPGLRNHDWRHLIADDVISMPDKWEYPWFAAWDLAFHTVALAVVDIGVRQAAARAAAATAGTCTPTASCRRTSGTSATSTRRCTRGRPGSSTSWRRPTTGNGDRAFLENAFQQADEELHLVAQPQGRRRPQRLPGRLPRPGQHRRLRPQRAAARPAATSTRPTAPRGWRCTARTCSRSPSNWPARTRSTWSRRRRCLRTSPGSPPRRTTSARTRSACGTRRTASSTTCCAARRQLRSR